MGEGWRYPAPSEGRRRGLGERRCRCPAPSEGRWRPAPSEGWRGVKLLRAREDGGDGALENGGAGVQLLREGDGVQLLPKGGSGVKLLREGGNVQQR